MTQAQVLPLAYHQSVLVSSSEIQAEPPASAPRSSSATFARNALMSVLRLMVTTFTGFILPAFLIRRLPTGTYSAWVLILQMSAYISYLDFGIQTGISKYVAEYDARGDAAGASRRASAGMLLLAIVSVLGVALTVVLAFEVPHLFHAMSPELYYPVRISLLLVGTSASLALASSIFAAIFTGLQRFAVPTALGIVNRVLFVAAVLVAVRTNGGLIRMGEMVAAVNVITGLLHFVAWRRLAGRIRLGWSNLQLPIVKAMLSYCSTTAIWTVGMLCVSGLDVTLVGRYDFTQTAFYSIAAAPANIMIAITGAAMAPLLPAASALSVHRTPQQMGQTLTRMTRYATGLLALAGLPLLVAGYPLLRIWLGAGNAVHVIGYMRILVVANLFRNLCAPYASMLVATDNHRAAIAVAISEGVVNLSASIFLARHIGAIGVAYGTLIGSAVSVGLHFALSMHYTRARFAVSRARLFLSGMARPLLFALPSLLLIKQWWRPESPAVTAPIWCFWALSSGVLAWFAILSTAERASLTAQLRDRMSIHRATI